MRLLRRLASPTPDRLLFTDDAGRPASLEQVMVAGLNGRLGNRTPALAELMAHGRADHALYAAALLMAWGRPDAYRNVARWVHEHEWPELREPFAPWPGTVPGPRHAPIADAIRVAGRLATAGLVETDRVAVTAHLLRHYASLDVGSALADALLADETLMSRIADRVGPTVDRAIEQLVSGMGGSSLAGRVAALLAPLATLSDERAAVAASALLGLSGDELVTVEVARALRVGSGPRTRALLERLAVDGSDRVRAVATASLAVRPRETTYPRWFDAGGRLIAHVEEAGGVRQLVMDEASGALVGTTPPADATAGADALSEAEFRARLADRRAALLRAWAERLCFARSQDVDGIAAALGVPIAPPPLGAIGAGWVDGYVHGVAFRFRLEILRWRDLTAHFGEGQEGRRIHWDSPHVRSFEVLVPDAPWRTLVRAESSDPPGPDVSVTSVDLRIERPPAAPGPTDRPVGGIQTCPECATPRAAPDAFCGSCGRFLEWSERPAPPAT